MTPIAEHIHSLQATLPPGVRLLAVSKYQAPSKLREAYEAGQRLFGENRVQEWLEKYPQLPDDIEWHFIGHLQVNKVKYLVPRIDVIQSVDSVKLLNEIDRQAAKLGRSLRVMLQIHIAKEEHKFGFSPDEAEALCHEDIGSLWPRLQVVGLMGMATFTDDAAQIAGEFTALHNLFTRLKTECFANHSAFCELSMGMSDDYPLALAAGTTIVRIGSGIFGERYATQPSNNKSI